MDDSAEVWKWQVQCWEKGAEELGKFWGSDTSSSPWRVCSGSVMVCAQDFNRLFSRGRGCARKRGRKWNCEIAQSCLTLCDPMDCSLPGSSVHGIFQARILEWVAISFSRRSSQPRDWTQVSRIVGRPFTIWATREEKQRSYPGISLNNEVDFIQ